MLEFARQGRFLVIILSYLEVRNFLSTKKMTVTELSPLLTKTNASESPRWFQNEDQHLAEECDNGTAQSQ